MADLDKAYANKELKDYEIYQRQVERLTDPFKGNQENPLKGIKGHHEIMLSTDMCLAFKANKTLNKCFGNKKPFKVADSKWTGLSYSQHMTECRANFWQPEYFSEMFPEDSNNCCAWVKPKNAYNFGIYSYTEEKEICGVNITNERITNETCC